MTVASVPPPDSPRPWLDDPTLALRQRLAGAPPGGLVKGWLFRSIIEGARRFDVDLGGSRRLGFKDYPVADYLELLGEASHRVNPEQPPRETLRLLGRSAYPSFAQSLFGKVIISTLGSGHEGARTGLRRVTQVYKLTSNHAVATMSHGEGGVSVVELDNIWSFPDSYHAGIFEGAAEAFGGRASVSARPHSLCSATLTLRWEG